MIGKFLQEKRKTFLKKRHHYFPDIYFDYIRLINEKMHQDSTLKENKVNFIVI